MQMSLRLIQRIDKLQLEIQGIQIKLQQIQNPVPKIPVDALISIVAHLKIVDLIDLRVVNKEFNLAASYMLKQRSLEQMQELKRAIHDAEVKFSLVKQSVLPDISGNMEFLQDEEIIQKVYSQFGNYKDHVTTLVMKCISTLYNDKVTTRHFNSRRFKEWFLHIGENVAFISDRQVELVEHIIRENDITYEIAREKGQFTFRLLIIIAAMLEVQKLRKTIKDHESAVFELEQEEEFLRRVVCITKNTIGSQ